MSFYLELQANLLHVRERYSNEHADFSRNPIKAIEQLQADYKQNDEATHRLQVLLCFCRDMPQEKSGPASELLMFTHRHVGLGRWYSASVYGEHLNNIMCSLYRTELLNTEMLEWLEGLSFGREGWIVRFFAERLQELEPFLTLDILKSVMTHCYSDSAAVLYFAKTVNCFNHFLNRHDVECLAKQFQQRMTLFERLFFCVQNELVQAAITAAVRQRHLDFSDIMNALFYRLNMSNFQQAVSLTEETLADLLAIINSNYLIDMARGLKYLAQNNLLTPENRTFLIENPRLISYPLDHRDRGMAGLLLRFVWYIKRERRALVYPYPLEELIYLDQALLQHLARWSTTAREVTDGVVEAVALIVKNYPARNMLEFCKKLLSIDLETGQLFFIKKFYRCFNAVNQDGKTDAENEADFDQKLKIAGLVSRMNRANDYHIEIAIKLYEHGLASVENLQQLHIVCERPQGTELAIWHLCLELKNINMPLDQQMLNYILLFAPLLIRMNVLGPQVDDSDNLDDNYYIGVMLRFKRWMDTQQCRQPTIQTLNFLSEQKTLIEERLEKFIAKELAVAQVAVEALVDLTSELNLQEQALLPLPLMVLYRFCAEQARVQALPKKLAWHKEMFFGAIHDHTEISRSLEPLKKG